MEEDLKKNTDACAPPGRAGRRGVPGDQQRADPGGHPEGAHDRQGAHKKGAGIKQEAFAAWLQKLPEVTSREELDFPEKRLDRSEAVARPGEQWQ
eukprot:11403388-Heterocapsa_arctica.AAC.1